MINVKQAEKLVKKTLSHERSRHTLNVKKTSMALAEIYGENKDNTALAALLHDIAKELTRESLLQILKRDVIIADNCLNRSLAVWHGAAAAILAKTEYGVKNVDILNAIQYHTTGRKGMSRLEKIIYMADMTSDERSYPEAPFLRDMVFEDLNKGTIEGLHQSIIWLKSKNKAIDSDTINAYNYLCCETKE